MMHIDLAAIDRLTGRRLGQFDTACPLCGPERRSHTNRLRKVLRIWRIDESFASYHCARCGEKGHARDINAPPPDLAKLTKIHAEAYERERVSRALRIGKAQWLWQARAPIVGSIAETYLRQARGYSGQLPATLGFLPPRGKHGPAMIAAFGTARELESGQLTITADAVVGVHLTRLAADGAGKAKDAERDKIMVGACRGAPIMLAPINDLLGLAVAEGIEDTLSTIEATGLGGWAAGSAAHMPALSDAIPSYLDQLTIMADDDKDGRRHAARLGELVTAREIAVRQILLSQRWSAAA